MSVNVAPEETNVENPKTSLLPPADSQGKFKVYKRRWYVLALYAAGTLWQCNVFNTVGPIADSVKCAFDWTDAEIALIPLLACIAYVVSVHGFTAVLEKLGLRVGVLCLFFLVAGVGFCLIQPPGAWTKVFIFFGIFLNGLAGPVACSGNTLVSGVWFPPDQRTTSTAIASMANVMGLASSFLLGPFVVEQRNCTIMNGSNSTGNWTESPKQLQLEDINRLLTVETIVAGALLVMALVYFPRQPPTPPSVSAAARREPFITSLRLVFTNWRLWLISCIFGMYNGSYQGWLSIAVVMLEPLNISQKDCGWMGFYSVVGGAMVGLLVSYVADRLRRRHKTILFAMMVLSIGFNMWLILMIERVLPFVTTGLWVSFIVCGVLYLSTSPLFYELGCECAFPVGESITTGQMTLVQNAFSGLFLLMPSIFGDSLGAKIINWSLISVSGLCIVFIVLFPPVYLRLGLDDRHAGHSDTQSTSQEPSAQDSNNAGAVRSSATLFANNYGAINQ